MATPVPNRLTRAVANLGRLASSSATLIHNAWVRSISANVLESCGITVVGVDTNHFAAIPGSSALDIHVALALARAVSARAVDLTVVLGVKVDNVNGTAAVVLNNLVGGVVGAATNDPTLLTL